MKAVVLGARDGSGNIGDATAEFLKQTCDMQVWTSDCKVWTDDTGDTYAIPGEAVKQMADADTLVVTLGRTSMEPFDRISKEEIEEVIRGCLLLPLLAARSFVEQREGQGGRIVLVGSYAHRHPFSTGTAYCAAKAGIEMAGRTLGWELTDKGFRTFVVHPFHVFGTPMWEKVHDGLMEHRNMTHDEATEYAEKDLKMRTMLPEEVAEVIGLILTEPKLAWMSGSNVELYGGTR